MKKYLSECSKVMLYSLLMLFLFMGSQYLIVLLTTMLFGSKFANEHMYLRTILSYGVVIVGLIGINRVENKTFREVYKGFTKKMAKQALQYALPMWLGIGVLNVLLLPFFPEYNVEINSLFVNDEMILRFMVLVIGAPFVEEYLFREKVQIYTKKRFGKIVAMIFQGILFGMIHPFGMQKIYASALGIGLGFIREKTGHLLAPTMIHVMINGIGFIGGLLGGGQ